MIYTRCEYAYLTQMKKRLLHLRGRVKKNGALHYDKLEANAILWMFNKIDPLWVEGIEFFYGGSHDSRKRTVKNDGSDHIEAGCRGEGGGLEGAENEVLL